MAGREPISIRDLLLTRQGVAFVPSAGQSLPESQVQAVALELAALGYVSSTRLAVRLTQCSLEQLTAFRTWACEVLSAHVGGGRRHEPLFRRFPEGIPDDTLALWWHKVLVHFLQAEGQPCLFCQRTGTTHVLNPCRHVVCDHCFDGANYSACPVCEHHVDRTSPFFQPAPEHGQPVEKVTFKLLDLGESLESAAKELFLSLCRRKQALSPTDREALVVVLREYKTQVLAWLPPAIPVRENVAIIFGTLFQECPPVTVLPQARRYMTTATDVLRFLAVLSGTDGSLQRETVFKQIEYTDGPSRFWGKIAQMLKVPPPDPVRRVMTVPIRVHRFKMARLPRPLRRALLELLEGFEPERLIEDMLRHQSYWVWAGEFLHPHEYAARFPHVARAFLTVRGKSLDGILAPRFQSWNARVEEAVAARDVQAVVDLLGQRPGELARRFDHALRLAGDGPANGRPVLEAFAAHIARFATPVLLTLRSQLPTRSARAGVRVYWPKGQVAKGVSGPDHRPVLSPEIITPAVRLIDGELLQRFAAQPALAEALIDEDLRSVIVPFNERTASKSAVNLPRGSRVPVPSGKLLRLFLHWCQPKGSQHSSDLDLSVAFYDAAWRYVGVCSYYQLQCTGVQGLIAQSAGDLTNAPWPEGATEFVDVHREPALAAGIRYAVMVVNNYAGLPFSLLERGFAGLMLRDDPGGAHFDPRTVELKFALAGENGVFMPLVLDMVEGVLHWLDVHAKGQFEMNNVESSKSAIAKICPELMAYFASGVRPSMFELALLHAAARCPRVWLRGSMLRCFERRHDEDAMRFHTRLLRGEADGEAGEGPAPDGPPLLAALYRGNVDLPKGSSVYALFRERVATSVAASDLLA